MTVRIAEGHFGSVRLEGVRFAAAFSFPGAMHEGNGIFQLIVDQRATAQRLNRRDTGCTTPSRL
jgi:hypothetical protein